MWGNLAVGSGDRWREVCVPFLQPGQVRWQRERSFHLSLGKLILLVFLFIALNYMDTISAMLYTCCLEMLMILSVCLGRHSECSAVCSLCGGLLHLALASGPRWGAVWTQGLVQHCGRSSCPSTHDGWRNTSVTLCHATGRKKLVDEWKQQRYNGNYLVSKAK